MYADFAAECAEDDPVLVVPWAAEPDEIGLTLGRRFVDLRADPWAFEEIPEAELHPALLESLRALNAPRSPVWTAKCDAWPLDADEVAVLAADLELEAADSRHGFGSYLDLLLRDLAHFASYHRTEQMCLNLLRQAGSLDLPGAALRCVVRPALVDFDGAREGFAVSLYLSAVAGTAAEAYTFWSNALRAVTRLIRSREFRAGARESGARQLV